MGTTNSTVLSNKLLGHLSITAKVTVIYRFHCTHVYMALGSNSNSDHINVALIGGGLFKYVGVGHPWLKKWPLYRGGLTIGWHVWLLYQ